LEDNLRDIVSFLLKSDQHGRIQETLWSQPIYLLDPQMQIQTLYDLFADDQQIIIDNLLEQIIQDPGTHRSLNRLQLRNQDTEISCYILAAQDQLLILGCELSCQLVSGQHDPLLEHFQLIIHRFMESLLSRFDGEAKSKDPLSRDHFEQIQLLNNELINTHRRLQKANTQLKHLNEILNNRLVKDPLTGLISRYQYQSEIEQVINSDPGALGVFIFIDIDNFKSVNDTYGHPAGDSYLKDFADRLKNLKLPPDRISMRISGDEFGIYIHGLDVVDDALLASIWRQFEIEVIGSPIQIDNLKIPVNCSMGMAVYGQDTHHIYELIEYADFAMYVAKNSGKRGYRRFNREAFDHDRKIKSGINSSSSGNRPDSDHSRHDSGHQPDLI
jgi:diguanylate cyclase (GGDEF)-like protein